MKNLLMFLLASSIFAFFQQCKQKEPIETPKPTNWGESAALLNGTAWAGLPWLTSAEKAGSKGLFFLSLSTFSLEGYQRHLVSFILFPFSKKRYPLFKTTQENIQQKIICSNFATTISDGDVAGSYYHLLEQDTIEDFFEIERVDSTTNEIWGRFQASFVVDSFSKIYGADKSLPDTVVFRNGTFHTKILE